MAHPELWMMDSGLKKRPLLPVLGSDRGMSLDEARKRGRQSTLWMSEGECRLVKRAVEKGAVVLDAGDGPFKKVISRLPGIVDLDEIAALKPLSPAELPEDLGRVTTLVKRMNRILVSAGLGGLSFRLTFAPLSTPARDIDLTSLGFSSAKHVVVPARSEILERAAASRNGDLPFAAFTALSMLMGESAMLREHRAVLLRRAARTVFEEAKWTRP
jgi:hypothetical protein